jgi:hypothetical protein
MTPEAWIMGAAGMGPYQHHRKYSEFYSAQERGPEAHLGVMADWCNGSAARDNRHARRTVGLSMKWDSKMTLPPTVAPRDIMWYCPGPWGVTEWNVPPAAPTFSSIRTAAMNAGS